MNPTYQVVINRNSFYFSNPRAKFVGFIDGIGWYIRKKDLARMVEAYDEVFTFHQSELKRFEKFTKSVLKGNKNE